MRWHHIGIHVSKLESSTQFYEKFFQFTAVESIQLPGESIVFLENGGMKLELMQQESEAPVVTENHFCWNVEDLDEWMNHLRQAGLSPAEGPLQLNNGWKTVFYEGPDGELIELLQETGQFKMNPLLEEL